MDKSVIEAMVNSIGKEEIEKHIPEIRKKVAKETITLINSKKFNTTLRKQIIECLESQLEDDLYDWLDTTTINKVVRKAINKIVGA